MTPAICLTPEERTRLAALYPPDPPKVLARSTPLLPRLRTPPPPPCLKGERHGMAILTDELVSTLRMEAATGLACKESAPRHGLHHNTALHAIRGDSWKHVKTTPVVSDRVNIVDDIRKTLRNNVLAEFKAGQIKCSGSNDQVRVALHRLTLRGEVERTGRGLYRWASATATPA